LTAVTSFDRERRVDLHHVVGQEVIMLTKAKDIGLVLSDRPGTLAKVTEAVALAGINIDGFSGASECGDTFHLLLHP